MSQSTPTPAATETVVIQDLDTSHDRQVTASHGNILRGRWVYPARVFNGITQYQTRDGEWVDLEDEPQDLEPDAGDGTP